jgi:hypothetical protein
MCSGRVGSFCSTRDSGRDSRKDAQLLMMYKMANEKHLEITKIYRFNKPPLRQTWNIALLVFHYPSLQDSAMK